MFIALPYPQIDPAIFTIPAIEIAGLSLGPFPLRWYAMAYITGIFLALFYINFLRNRPKLWTAKKAPVSYKDIDDFLFWAVLGVILGGRLGYILFYQLIFAPEILLADPLMVIRIWDGGMAFHGGLIGVVLAMLYVAKTRGISLLNLADLTAAAVPIGLFLGRIANFINGELWGRPTDAAWGMVFPAADWQVRHPSQLYEAALEGLLLFTLLGIAVWRFTALKYKGLCTGIFLAGYGLSRIFVENFREPDRFVTNLPEWFTMGMLLSLPMVITGLYLIYFALKSDAQTSSKSVAKIKGAKS